MKTAGVIFLVVFSLCAASWADQIVISIYINSSSGYLAVRNEEDLTRGQIVSVGPITSVTADRLTGDIVTGIQGNLISFNAANISSQISSSNAFVQGVSSLDVDSSGNLLAVGNLDNGKPEAFHRLIPYVESNAPYSYPSVLVTNGSETPLIARSSAGTFFLVLKETGIAMYRTHNWDRPNGSAAYDDLDLRCSPNDTIDAIATTSQGYLVYGDNRTSYGDSRVTIRDNYADGTTRFGLQYAPPDYNLATDWYSGTSVTALAVTPDDKIVIGLSNGTVELRPASNLAGMPLASVSFSFSITALAVTQGGNIAVATSDGGKVYVRSSDLSRDVSQPMQFGGTVTGLAITHSPSSVNYYDPCSCSTKAFYPYGWYGNDSNMVIDNNFDKVGGNTVLVTTMGNGSISYENLVYILDRAQSQGKKVIICFLNTGFYRGLDPCDNLIWCIDPNEPNTYAGIANYVNPLKTHPALLGWMLSDENEYHYPLITSTDVINAAFIINRILDGKHQVWQNFASGFGYDYTDPYSRLPVDPFSDCLQYPFLPLTNGYSTDLYPFNSENGSADSFANVEWYQNGLHLMGQTAAANNTACMLLSQGFGNCDGPGGTNLEHWQWLPTQKEHRWQVLSSLTIGGSRGVLNWIYDTTYYTASGLAKLNKWIGDTAKPLFSEEEMIARGMETGYNVGAVDANWTSRSTDSTTWLQMDTPPYHEYERVTQLLVYDKYRNACFLIVSNNGPSSQNAQFTMSYLPAPPTELNVLAYGLSSMRNLTLTDLGGGSYKLVDILPAFEAFIYHINVTNSVFNIGYNGSMVFIGDDANDWNTTSIVSSSSDSALTGRESIYTINGTGISTDGFMHDCDTPWSKMWVSGATAGSHSYVTAGTHWTKYSFDKLYSLKEMWIWNYNEYNAGFDGPSFGMKQVRILASDTDDQTGWTDANTNPVFEGIIPKATGTSTNPVNRVIDFGNRHARYVLITSVADTNHNWSSGAYGEDGLSEVRFFKSDWDASSAITATADSAWYGAVNTVNSSGISSDGLTQAQATTSADLSATMWLSDYSGTSHSWVNAHTHWIKYSFDKIYSLKDIWIWNYNQYNSSYDAPATGMKQVRILASTTDNSTGWTAANSNPVFEGTIPRANGTAANPVNKVVDCAGRQAKYILITSAVGNEHNWSNGGDSKDGLSEVRFYVKKPFVGDNGTNWNTSSTITSSSDSAYTDRESVKTINGSGISTDGLTHATGIPQYQMWISDGTARSHTYVNTGTHWIQYNFDKVYSLKDMWIWNCNDSVYSAMGMKQIRVLASSTDDSTGWTDANSHPVYEGIIPEADGTSTNPVNKVVNFAGLRARYVLITSDVGNEHNWSNGTIANDGISEVRFHIQQQASTPSPAIDAINVSLTPMLIWTIGDNATSHDVYFGTNKGNVTNATHASSEYKINQTGTSYAPGTLVNNATYYWRIDEVGPGGTITGDVWSFTTIKAVPTFVAAGAVTSNTTAITPALPAGIATNDILLLFLETSNQAISISNQNGGTWTAVTNSPQYCGTAAGTTGARLTVFWSRYNGTQGAPTTSDSGDHQLGRMIAIRGAVSSGNPWDVTAGGTEAVSDTSGSIPGATTTVANTLVVTAIATSLPDLSSTTRFSAWTNANLTSLTERTDNSITAGNGGGLGVATGIRAATGAYGNTAVTLATAAYKGMMSIAVKP